MVVFQGWQSRNARIQETSIKKAKRGDADRQTCLDEQHLCHVLTLSWAQGSLGWMTVVFLFHVPQYAGR